MPQVAIDPFVGGLAADAVFVAQIADVSLLTKEISDELSFLVHG
jgi:hypothetical protein